MKSAQFGGKTVELGANWIHGITNNPIYQLAQKYGLQMVKYDWDDWIVRSSTGNDVTATADSVSGELEAAIKAADKRSKDKFLKFEPDISWRSAFNMAHWIKKDEVAQAVEWYYFDFDYGLTPEEVSLKGGPFSTNSELYPGGDMYVTDPRGFKYIFERLLGEYLKPNDARLKLNHVVSKIEYTFHPNRHGVKVTTNLGAVYEADYAIVTFPLGVFQHNKVQFAPPLPLWKMDVLNNMGTVMYLKIFVKFPAGTVRFWDNKLNIIHAHARRGYYTHWQNLETGNIHPAGTNLMTVSVLGWEARAVSRMPKAEVIAELNTVLQKLYGNRAVGIEDILIPDWIENPLSHGMYGCWPSNISNKTFHAIPAPVGPLFFAGEHTSRKLYGYLHAAYLTGIRAAEEVVECANSRYCPSTFYSPQQRPGFYYRKKK